MSAPSQRNERRSRGCDGVKRGVKQASTEPPADTGGARTTDLLIGAVPAGVPKMIYRPKSDPEAQSARGVKANFGWGMFEIRPSGSFATGFIKCAYRMDCAVPATEGPTSSC
jgi:hypothetical protein